MDELRQALVNGLMDERYEHIWDEQWFNKLDELIPSKWWHMADNLSGNVVYAKKAYPDDGLKYDAKLMKFTESSFTKMVLWMERQEIIPIVNRKSLQVVQDILAEYAQSMRTTYTFKVVEGQDIVKYYCTGVKSCMLGKKAQVQMYADNPNRIQLVVAEDEAGYYVARALLWTLDDDTKLLDRGYPNNTPVTRQMRQWAKAQGIQTLKNDSGYMPGWSAAEDYVVTLPHPKNRRIPYLDTLSRVYRSELNIDHIKLHSRPLEEQMELDTELGESFVVEPRRTLDPGDSVGVSLLYNERVIDFAGLPVFMDEPYLLVGFKGLRPIVLTKYSAEKVYVIESIPVLKSMFVEIEGKLFFKDQVRKVRGENRYKPKDGVLYYYLPDDEPREQDTVDFSLLYIQEYPYVSDDDS